jgi:ArsR family transcriptional regulator
MKQIEAYRGCRQNIKVLSNPNRFLIFNLLMTGAHCHCEIAESLHLSPSLLTHHLTTLCESGLVDATHDSRDARWIHYTINTSALEDFRNEFLAFTDPNRIRKRESLCEIKLGAKEKARQTAHR